MNSKRKHPPYKEKGYQTAQHLLSLLTCLLLLFVVTIHRDNKMGEHSFPKETFAPQSNISDKTTLRKEADGNIIISTLDLTHNISGYNGPTPLEITLKQDTIKQITLLPNSETPGFIARIEKSSFYDQWIGMTIEKALAVNVETVTGATLSSTAIAKNIYQGLSYAKSKGIAPSSAEGQGKWSPSVAQMAALLVILLGCLAPLWMRHKLYRPIQLLLNVVVLGFWSKSFLSYSLIINFLSNGINLSISLIAVLLLVVAFVFPFLGKNNYYCTWLCPLGSLQELAGRCSKKKWHPSPKTLKVLRYLRDGIWCLLMVLMCLGIFFQWMDYELFTFFLLQQASWAVVIVTVLFVVLSVVISRPYCRFVCPTGSLFRLSQKFRLFK